jgi:hypothetical protein
MVKRSGLGARTHDMNSEHSGQPNSTVERFIAQTGNKSMVDYENPDARQW